MGRITCIIAYLVISVRKMLKDVIIQINNTSIFLNATIIYNLIIAGSGSPL